MMWPLGQTLRVSLDDLATGQGAETLDLGRVAWSRDRRAAVFEASEGVDASILSPASPLMAKRVSVGNPTEFDGLHGVFADSLPDGWGTLLVDREAAARGIRRGDLTPVDRLAVVGSGGMGALAYRPEVEAGQDVPDLDAVARLSIDLLGDAEVPVAEVTRLRAALGGSGGALPKIVCQIGPGDVLRPAQAPPEAGFAHWIVKFAARKDGPHAAVLEEAYARMARAAGIEMPPTRVIDGATGRYFAVRRFDRDVAAGPGDAKLRRWHMLSAAGGLESAHRRYAFGYETLLAWVFHLSRDRRAVEEGFRRAAFNVMVHNRDDHARQHAMLLDRDGAGRWRWRLSPAYDLTPSVGPGGEHSLDVMGLGRDVDHAALLRLGEAGGLRPERVEAALDEVSRAVAGWADHADAAGVPRRVCGEVAALHTVLG
jgi:serine/threonine-protein kinase HipA